MALKRRRPRRAQDAARSERRLYERRAELYVEGKDAHALAAHVLQPDPLGRFARVFETLRPERGETALVAVDLLPLSRGQRHRHVGRLVAAARDATAVDGQGGVGRPAVQFARGVWAGMNGDSGPLLGRRPSTPRANPADLAVRRAELRPTVVRITETDALFALQVLLKTTATSKGRAVELLVALRDCFAAFTGSSWFKTRGIGPTLRLGNREVTPFFLGSDMLWHRGWFDHRLASGFFDPPRRGNVVAGKEVAAFLRPPTKHCASTEVVRSGGLIPAPPADLPTYRYQPDLLPLGEIDTADGTRLVAVPADDTKFVYTSGRSDFGKTTGALCRFLHWALRTSHGGLFLDPHVDGLVEMLPYLTGVAERLVIVNLADTNKQGGWNLCSMTGRTRNDIEARVDAIVDSVATVTGWGERNGRALNLISQAAKSVIELAMVLPHDLQPTIFQITTLLSDPDWRDAVVPYLSPPLRAFWRTRFGLLDTNATTPVTNLIDRLRNSRSVSALLGASQSSFDMRRAMDTGQLVLVCPAGSGRKERLIANFVIRDLYRAALTRIDVARERRRPFYAVFDELQIYDDETLPEMLEQLRKFQVKGDLLNQDPRRLRNDTWAGLTTNRSVLQSSTLGEGGAKIIAGELGGEVSTETIMSLQRHTFVSQVRLGNQTTKPFLIRTVPPDRMWSDHRNDAALADLDAQVDRTMRRRPVDDTIAELNTLDGRILDWLKQHRPRQPGTSPNGGKPGGAPPTGPQPGMVGRSRTRKRKEALDQ